MILWLSSCASISCCRTARCTDLGILQLSQSTTHNYFLDPQNKRHFLHSSTLVHQDNVVKAFSKANCVQPIRGKSQISVCPFCPDILLSPITNRTAINGIVSIYLPCRVNAVSFSHASNSITQRDTADRRPGQGHFELMLQLHFSQEEDDLKKQQKERVYIRCKEQSCELKIMLK